MEPRNLSPRSRAGRPPVGSFLATFGVVWLVVGLFTGTLVLVVAVRWLVGLLHHFGLGQTAESRTLIGVIFVFVVASFLLTRALVRRLYRVESVRVRRLVLSSLVIPAGLTMYAWSDPGRMLAAVAGSQQSSLAMAGGPEFIFGAYPDYQKLQELKKEGVTAVVSLQHPSVVVELQGIEAEKDATRQLGLTLIQAPMLPWISDNEQSLGTIRRIATQGHGRYYVHCGLGRDRVNVAKRLIASLGGTNAVHGDANLKEALGFDSRTEPFERGRPWRLAADVWMIPYPNAAEFFGYVLQGRAGRVILALDTTVAQQAAWLAEAERQMRTYAVPFEVMPLHGESKRELAALEARIEALPKPVTVIVGHTPFEPGDRAAKAAGARALMRAFDAVPRADSVAAGGAKPIVSR